MEHHLTHEFEIPLWVFNFQVNPDHGIRADRTANPIAAVGQANTNCRAVFTGKQQLGRRIAALDHIQSMRRKAGERGGRESKQYPPEQKLPPSFRSPEAGIAIDFADAQPRDKRREIVFANSAAVEQPYGGRFSQRFIFLRL
jgi:hypothetical protein